jgi:RHS repeat-associated protein
MWNWFPPTFGNSLPNTNPGGAGTFKYDLRYPGQIYDGQAGLHQNFFRDFDPAVGRYVESDPIGLEGGVNTYGYVGANPISRVDPTGLVNPGEVACIAGPNPVCDVSVVVDVISTIAGVAAIGATVGQAPMQMASKGNVADTQIVNDYGKAASAAKLCGGKPPDRCDWLKQNAGKYRPDQVKATEKAWGCRRSSASK